MSLLDRARASGRCPPSLLQSVSKEDQFESVVSRVLDANGTFVVRVQMVSQCYLAVCANNLLFSVTMFRSLTFVGSSVDG
jgi:hypothetical protein